MVLASKILHKFVCVIYLHTFSLDIGGWHASQSSKTFESHSSDNSFIVTIKLGVGFLKEGHPPGTGIRSLSEGWHISSAVFSSWKFVINVDSVPFVLDPEIKSEGTVLIIFLIPGNSLYSLFTFSNCRCSC